MATDIEKYNASLAGEEKKICKKLKEVIDKELSKAESKVWHRTAVWFLEGNPIAGYAPRKKGIQLLFWSGQSFKDSGLKPEGSFKAAEMYYTSEDEIKVTALRGWLKQAKKIQWDYKNIVKNKGKLNKIGKW